MSNCIYICFFFDEKWCSVTLGLRNRWFHLQIVIKNEMGGLQKRDRFWFASCLWTCWCSLPRFNIRQLVLEWCSRMKTSRQGNRQMADKVRRKKRGPKRDQNEIRPHPDRTPSQPLPYWWWKSSKIWDMRLKRGRGTPYIFFTGPTEWIKAAAHMGTTSFQYQYRTIMDPFGGEIVFEI